MAYANLFPYLPYLKNRNINIFIVTYRFYNQRKILLHKLMRPNDKFHFHFPSLFVSIYAIWLFELAFLRRSPADRVLMGFKTQKTLYGHVVQVENRDFLRLGPEISLHTPVVFRH